MLQIGNAAPDFNLPDQDGKFHRLSDLKGKWVFLYFYPKDETFGCTKEACSVRDNLEKLTSFGAEVFGASVDSVASHKKFQENHQLNFPLLSDESKEVVRAYEVWGEKSLFGKKYSGINRTSFLINPDGNIAKIYEKVDPQKHVDEVLTDLAALKK